MTYFRLYDVTIMQYMSRVDTDLDTDLLMHLELQQVYNFSFHSSPLKT